MALNACYFALILLTSILSLSVPNVMGLPVPRHYSYSYYTICPTIANDPQLVGGGLTTFPEEFPHQVYLKYNRGFYSNTCGGTILNPFVILTAAHCVEDPDPRYYTVVAGEHDTLCDERTEQIKTVVNISIHENFVPNVYSGNDIAILVLNSPLEFNQGVRPIAYPKNNSVEFSGNATLIGWGYTGKLSPPARYLQKLSVPLIPESSCREQWWKAKIEWETQDIMQLPGMYQEWIGNFKNVTSAMVCAGGEQCKSAYGGDSGGGLICQHPVTEEKTLCGIVSYGSSFNCDLNMGDPLPDVYTNVSHFVPWIDAQINTLLGQSICPRNFFHCNTTHGEICIGMNQICDGISDCMSNADEKDCTINRQAKTNQPTCAPGYFQCSASNKICVRDSFRCDGEIDCENMEDEENCPGHAHNSLPLQ